MWEGHGADLSGVNTAAVTAAVLREAGALSAGSAQFFVVALRSFLRYCFLTGVIVDEKAARIAISETGND